MSTRTNLSGHRDFPLSAEDLAGLDAADDQIIDAAEVVTIDQAISDHAAEIEDVGPRDTDYVDLLATARTSFDVPSYVDYVTIFNDARVAASGG